MGALVGMLIVFVVAFPGVQTKVANGSEAAAVNTIGGSFKQAFAGFGLMVTVGGGTILYTVFSVSLQLLVSTKITCTLY